MCKLQNLHFLRNFGQEHIFCLFRSLVFFDFFSSLFIAQRNCSDVASLFFGDKFVNELSPFLVFGYVRSIFGFVRSHWFARFRLFGSFF